MILYLTKFQSSISGIFLLCETLIEFLKPHVKFGRGICAYISPDGLRKSLTSTLLNVLSRFIISGQSDLSVWLSTFISWVYAK